MDATAISTQRGNANAHLENYRTLSTQLSDNANPSAALIIAIADALISYMRVCTDANSLVLIPTGGVATSDTPENMQLWKEHAKTALDLLTPLLKDPDVAAEPRFAALYAEAIMYRESSRGIAKSILSGGAVSFMSVTAAYYDKHRLYESASPCTYKGAFQLAAPWPVGSAKKGRKFFEEALEAHKTCHVSTPKCYDDPPPPHLVLQAFPDSKRNRYYAAIGAWATGDRTKAIEMFKLSLAASRAPEGESELDIEEFLERAARKALADLGEASDSESDSSVSD